MFWASEVVMGLALAGIGMAVMHDGNHGAFSDKKGINRLIGGVLELDGWQQ